MATTRSGAGAGVVGTSTAAVKQAATRGASTNIVTSYAPPRLIGAVVV